MSAKLKFVSALLLSLPLSANAALVTLQSTWTYKLFPTSLGVSGTGLFTFTVEDTTPAIVTGTAPTQRASYKNAITAATFNLGSQTLTLDPVSDNSVGISTKYNSGGLDASISAWLLDGIGNRYEMYLGFEMYRDLTTLDIMNLDGLTNDDTPTAYIKPESCANPFTCGYALRQVGVQSEVPVPAAGWLFGAGLLSLASRKLRLRK